MIGSSVSLRHVSKAFGDTAAVVDLDLDVRAGELFCLLGPSGCGKSTTLRIVAGLEPPDGGAVWIGDRDMTTVPAHRRPVSTVFQSYALFPHLDVVGNVAYGFRWRKEVDRPDAQRRVDAALELVGLGGHRLRRISELSGGEQQRVALARALVLEPEVLLLDEPMGALDAQLRTTLQREVKAIQREVGITFVHVTHDQDEAFAIADRIAVMFDGRIAQVGTPRDLYARPESAEVAEFIGTANLLAATVTHPGTVDVAGVRLEVPEAPTPGPITVSIRPEELSLSADLASDGIRGRVDEVTFLGPTSQYRVQLVHGPAVVVIASSGGSTELVEVGDEVVVVVNPDGVHVIG